MRERDAVAELTATPVVERLLAESAPDGWWLASCRLLKVGRRHDRPVAVYRTVLRDDTPGGMRATNVVAEVYGPGRGAEAYGALCRLRMAGLRAPAAHRVPRPFGYDARVGVVVHELVTGPTWAEHLVGGNDRATRATAAAAGWLAHLHGLALDLPPAPPDREAAAIEHTVERLAAAYPEDAARLRALGGRVTGRLAPGARPPASSQGGLHPDDLVVEAQTATLVDVGALVAREPAHDVGRTLANLMIASGLRLGDVRPGLRAGGVLWRHYRTAGGANWRRVAAHAAAGFVLDLHQQLCVARNDRTELLVLWPRLAEAFLDSEGEPELADAIQRR